MHSLGCIMQSDVKKEDIFLSVVIDVMKNYAQNKVRTKQMKKDDTEEFIPLSALLNTLMQIILREKTR